MKVFVTGVCGQLGHDVMNELARCGHEGLGERSCTRIQRRAGRKRGMCHALEQLDITNAEAVGEASCAHGPTR